MTTRECRTNILQGCCATRRSPGQLAVAMAAMGAAALVSSLASAIQQRTLANATLPFPLPSPPPSTHESPPLHRLFFVNLDRRAERRVRFEHVARTRGLGSVIARFPAVDGHSLDLGTYPRSVVSEKGLQHAQTPPPVVNGVHLTRGALGLILSYHTLLKQIAEDPNETHVYVIAEDDAIPAADFCWRLHLCLTALSNVDKDWSLLHIGYYDDDCTVRPLDDRAMSSSMTTAEARELLCQPVQIFGLFGAAFRPPGARAVLEHLFPLEQQIDSSLSCIYGSVNSYAARTSLMTAEHSTADNTDIQILPPGFQFREK